jgi:phosphoserine phosphatase RsbU/P
MSSTPSPIPGSSQQQSQSSAGCPTRHPGFKANLDQFWLRVTEGLQLNQLWFQFRQDARTGFRLYRRDFEAGSPREQWRQKGWWHVVSELAWAILGKLSPPRRVLLLIGIVLLLLPSGGFQFHKGQTDFRISWGDPHFWGGVLLFLLLILEIADRVVMKRDLEIARDIQSWLLPATPPVVSGLTLAFATRPANTVAGDYYDVFPRPVTQPDEQKLLLAVADVAGKSIPAALLMATFQASLKTLSTTPCSLKELVMGLNRYACHGSQSGLRFTTAFLGELDPVAGVLNYINSGHNHPIGIQQDAAYEEGQVSLSSGDWLVIFTDGLVEAVNPFGEEYGEPRLLAVLQTNASMAPDLLLQRIISEVNTFVGTTPQHDDITCMLIKVG